MRIVEKDNIVQFIRFGIVGISNTVVNYLVNVIVLLSVSKLHLEWDYILANIVAFFLSVLWSFYWNYRFVFKSTEKREQSISVMLLKTYLSYGLTGIILNNILSWIWISCLGISKYIAPIINVLINVPINFILNKKWAFKE